MNDLERASLDLLKEVTNVLLSMDAEVVNHGDLASALAVLNCEIKSAWERSPEGIAEREADEKAEKVWLDSLKQKGLPR